MNRRHWLADLSIEELLNESITSVSKRETPLGEAPSAIAVLASEEIQQHGITSLPEALRLVPGLDVARIGASQWAISSRGFNNQYANKLLVLIDGRSVYTRPSTPAPRTDRRLRGATAARFRPPPTTAFT